MNTTGVGAEPDVELRPFHRGLMLAEPWFDDPDTIRYLGGRPWLARAFELAVSNAGQEFRGARQTASYRWLGWLDERLLHRLCRL